ncbi:MAG: TraR/DksA C4-type zinc finger protein [Caldilineaceae bacterium]|nr:TraR/DksA C4-type zinc finger protein [Caldilineaceae bacterium]MDE0429794.1 TraR/DksA C4-type zinc finger protein [Caldilineaceae bacterium]
MTKKSESERKRLLANLEQVNEELGHLRNLMLGEVDVELDEGDTEIVEREKTAALIAVLERRQQDIEHALRVIEMGQYGICERCGGQISPARLEVKPDATLCMNCQREVESINRRSRAPRAAPSRW